MAKNIHLVEDIPKEHKSIEGQSAPPTKNKNLPLNSRPKTLVNEASESASGDHNSPTEHHDNYPTPAYLSMGSPLETPAFPWERLTSQGRNLASRPLEESPDTGFTAQQALKLPLKYKDLGPIAAGGTAEIRRVRDGTLNRTMAMKLLKKHLNGHASFVSQFMEEARITSQLQHPGVVPVHEVGVLANGRNYFTMQEISGRTLRTLISEVHRNVKEGHWVQTPGGWSFHRLIDAFHRVCETVAYAHSRSIIHRDLKPSNMMVGEYGEVKVLDWGLAKSLVPPCTSPMAGTLLLQGASLQSTLLQPELKPRPTEAPGTPIYMAPELFNNPPSPASKASDVYALGATLYEILSGRPPYQGFTSTSVSRQVRQTQPHKVGRLVDHEERPIGLDWPPTPQEMSLATRQKNLVPPELERLCEWCLHRTPDARPKDAGVIAGGLAAWLEGARKRERALTAVQQADGLRREIEQLTRQARQYRILADRSYRGLNPAAPASNKRPAWRLYDQVERLNRRRDLASLSYVQHLRSALNFDSNLAEAHTRLARYYYRQHFEAERQGDFRRSEMVEPLIIEHDRDGLYHKYLRGFGWLNLNCSTPSTTVELYRYQSQDRRLVPEFVQNLGRTPLQELQLEWGSYLLVLSAPNHQSIKIPIVISRARALDVPEQQRPAIQLPRKSALGPDDLWVNGSTTRLGRDAEDFRSLPLQDQWVDSFIIRRFPVTNLEFLSFLNAPDCPLKASPTRENTERHQGGFQCDLEGKYSLKATQLPKAPVTQVDFPAAMAYAQWYSTQSGHNWTLPNEIQWEKAARGADGRPYPFGYHLDPAWACLFDSHSGPKTITSVHDYPDDISPYGVRGMAGNVMEWCHSSSAGPELGNSSAQFPRKSSPAHKPQVIKGGAILGPEYLANCAGRATADPKNSFSFLGFRLVRPVSLTSKDTTNI